MIDTTDCNLAGADLRGADLRGARLRDCILTEAIYDSDTISPSGFDPDPSLRLVQSQGEVIR
jgi:uncharacterized protein YjbI with pentapeptide repeats